MLGRFVYYYNLEPVLAARHTINPIYTIEQARVDDDDDNFSAYESGDYRSVTDGNNAA